MFGMSIQIHWISAVVIQPASQPYDRPTVFGQQNILLSMLRRAKGKLHRSLFEWH